MEWVSRNIFSPDIDDDKEDTHYIVTGDNEAPKPVPEFLTVQWSQWLHWHDLTRTRVAQQLNNHYHYDVRREKKEIWAVWGSFSHDDKDATRNVGADGKKPFSCLREGVLQRFGNINTINRQTLEDLLIIFRQKDVKPELQATVQHRWHRLFFDPNTMKLPNSLEEFNQGAENVFE